jgi:large conductance mechanosensitive channel
MPDSPLNWTMGYPSIMGTTHTLEEELDMGMVKEFKEFALKGNMVDMAVGIIIGGAFGLIIKSLIDDVIMPLVGRATGSGIDFSNMYIPLAEGVEKGLSLEEARAQGAVFAYGNFITVLINFLILAFVIFIMVKMMNNAKKKFEAEKAAAPAPKPAADVVLLTEIRDLLAKQD